MEVLKRHIVRLILEENQNLDWRTKIYLIMCIFNEKNFSDSNIIFSEFFPIRTPLVDEDLESPPVCPGFLFNQIYIILITTSNRQHENANSGSA